MRKLVEHRRNFGPGAPITEALIDIRCSTPDALELDDLRDFALPLDERFPTSRLQSQFESHIRVEGGQPNPSVAMQHAVRGFSFFSDKEDRVVQARRDGFTFSRLHPYDSWDGLRSEARELWERYCLVAQPVGVQRLAVRYINRIPLPSGTVQLSDWFNLHPQLPSTLESPMEEFLMRVVARHPDEPTYRSITTQATQPSGPDGRPAVMLDIDVFTHVQLQPDSEQVWKILEDLRTYKNDVFFATITDLAEAAFS